MKRFFTIAVVLTAALSCYAYYDYDYGYSNSIGSAWGFVHSILLIIFSILSIILFFKIWGMTNNIKQIREKMVYTEPSYDLYQKAELIQNHALLGDVDYVKRALLEDFVNSVIAAYNNNQNNLEKTIKPYIDRLILQYAKIGEEVPTYIINMKTFNDCINFFTKEDFRITLY